MLILIAGITGNIGQHAAHYALSCGHQVRGLGRSPDRLEPALRSQLESFIKSNTYYQIDALERAVDGVDAVICTYAGLPELHFEGQILLFRAAERAGVKRFLAASWNYDWRKVPFGNEPVYDPVRMFHTQLAITGSTLKPLHIFSGMLAEVFFGTEGQAGFTPKDAGVWDPEKKTLDIWGTGDEIWQFTTEEDAGKYGVEVVTGPDAEKGGFINVCSWQCSLKDVCRKYVEARGKKAELMKRGTIEDLDRMAQEGKEKQGFAGFWDWHRYVFHGNCLKGVWNLDDLENKKFPKVEPMTLVDFLNAYPEI